MFFLFTYAKSSHSTPAFQSNLGENYKLLEIKTKTSASIYSEGMTQSRHYRVMNGSLDCTIFLCPVLILFVFEHLTGLKSFTGFIYSHYNYHNYCSHLINYGLNSYLYWFFNLIDIYDYNRSVS